MYAMVLLWRAGIIVYKECHRSCCGILHIRISNSPQLSSVSGYTGNAVGGPVGLFAFLLGGVSFVLGSACLSGGLSGTSNPVPI